MKWWVHGWVGWIFSSWVWAGIHTTPIVLQAKNIGPVQYHPVEMYRVFRTAPDGTAVSIPFQIDERDRYGDFVLPNGPHPNTNQSNGVFDYQDELSLMGNDVGLPRPPTRWPFKKPSILYEVLFEYPNNLQTFGPKKDTGAVYVGAYVNGPPPEAPGQYVEFQQGRSEVLTSRYQYRFNEKNYLVVRGVDITPDQKPPKLLLDSSTFYLKADLKYFLTFHINEQDIKSELDAFKSGPIRTIARVNFSYTLLKLNFDLGMYTEVSFFSNSVILPAIIDNPLDGAKSLNKGSQFYYGFALTDNPIGLTLNSNMRLHTESPSLLNLFKSTPQTTQDYWLTALGPNYMIYLEMEPSHQMKQSGNLPSVYLENAAAQALQSRSRSARPLGESPVNVAVTFDLKAFTSGVHEVRFRLFVENVNDPKILEEYKNISKWKASAKKL